MNTVCTKLEGSIVTYLQDNWQGTGEELEGSTILTGTSSDQISTEERVYIRAESAGGPNARLGNFEVSVAIEICTDANKQSTDTEDPIVTHERRVEALAGIFGEAQVSTVKAALMAIDDELGVSAFWGYDRDNDFDGSAFRTTLRKTFEAYLAPED